MMTKGKEGIRIRLEGVLGVVRQVSTSLPGENVVFDDERGVGIRPHLFNDLHRALLGGISFVVILVEQASTTKPRANSRHRFEGRHSLAARLIDILHTRSVQDLPQRRRSAGRAADPAHRGSRAARVVGTRVVGAIVWEVSLHPVDDGSGGKSRLNAAAVGRSLACALIMSSLAYQT